MATLNDPHAAPSAPSLFDQYQHILHPDVAKPETKKDEPCWRGVVFGYDEENEVVIVAPRACGRWDCDRCADYKARRYAALIFAANPERHITLTCNPKLYKNPEAAYVKMKDCLRKLMHQLRKNKALTLGGVDGPPRTVEYAAVWEKHKSGWPHVHIANWGHYLPHHEIRARWQALTGAWIVHIRAMENGEAHRHNFVKYLADKTKLPASKNPNTRRVSFSTNYHRNAHHRVSSSTASNTTWFWLTVAPELVFRYLRQVCGAVEVPNDQATVSSFKIPGGFHITHFTRMEEDIQHPEHWEFFAPLRAPP